MKQEDCVPVVGFYRNQTLESVHYGVAAIVDVTSNQPVWQIGNPNAVIFTRSSLKPFQAVQFVESGAFAALGLSEQHLAIACASHSGTTDHINLVKDIVARAKVGAYLSTPLEHNCSGKHAAMLAVCAHKRWPLASYLEESHPLQQEIRRIAAVTMNLNESALITGTDDCNAPNYATSLTSLAFGYARLASAYNNNEDSSSLRAIACTMAKHPHLVGSTTGIESQLSEWLKEPIIAKVGAEGVLGVGIPRLNIGITLKVSDGNPRARLPFITAILIRAGIVKDQEVIDKGSAIGQPVWKNSKQIVVGHFAALF